MGLSETKAYAALKAKLAAHPELVDAALNAEFAAFEPLAGGTPAPITTKTYVNTIEPSIYSQMKAYNYAKLYETKPPAMKLALVFKTEEIPNLPTKQMEEVINIVGDHAFIAGGAARLAILGDDAPVVGDIDVFYKPFSIGQATVLQDDREALYKIGYIDNYSKPTPNTLTLTKDGETYPVQLVLPTITGNIKCWGTPQEVITDFSFTTEMFAIEKVKGKYLVHYTNAAYNATKTRTIIINKTSSGPLMMARVIKYIKKGYSIHPEEITKIFQHFAAMTPQEQQKVLSQTGDIYSEWLGSLDKPAKPVVSYESIQNLVAEADDKYDVYQAWLEMSFPGLKEK